MAAPQHFWVVPALGSIGALYAWWSQPYLGPDSVTSVVARSLVLISWLGVYVLVRKSSDATWASRNFAIGGVLGGGWWVLSFPLNESQGLVNVAMGIVVGTISGLFAALASSGPRAALVGIGVLAGQLLVDVVVLAVGWSRYSYGM
jgi:hypothetical protein